MPMKTRRRKSSHRSPQPPVMPQLIDLALLRNGLRKGAAPDKFLKRSVELIK